MLEVIYRFALMVMLLTNDDVEICNFEEVDLKDATVIAGFPSIGLVSTIAANYLIDALNLKQIGCVTSPEFPALSVVHTGEPLSPVRIYCGSQADVRKIVVLQWSKDKKCKLLISPEGMVVEGKGSEANGAVEAYAIGSTEQARNALMSKNIPQFKNGIIAGVSGVLLNIGKQCNFDVISILAEAHPNYPDARAAAAAINVIALLMGVEINVTPLYEESERIEKQLQKFHKQAKPMVSAAQAPQPNMYG